MKRYTCLNNAFLREDGDASKRTRQKRKSSDMLGHRWTMEELTRFYDAYCKYGKDWRKVARAVRNRSPEMVEALYSMNVAYLSLPHGLSSVDGLIATMVDHYSILDSDQESSGVGSYPKTKKRVRGNFLPSVTFEPSVQQFSLYSESIGSNYCLSLLRKKYSGGTKPRAVRRRTPRFPISYTHKTINNAKCASLSRQGLKMEADASEGEIEHEIAIALVNARKVGSPLVSPKPNKRADCVMSLATGPDRPEQLLAEIDDSKVFPIGVDEGYLEDKTEAVIGKCSTYNPYMVEFASFRDRQKAIKIASKKCGIYHKDEDNSDGIRTEYSGMKERLFAGAIKNKFTEQVNEVKISMPLMQRNKSKKVLRRVEGPHFDALKTLADLSSMMQTEKMEGSNLQLNGEQNDLIAESILEAMPPDQQKGTCESSKKNLSCCLLIKHLPKFCTFEWFYSAIDYPWFAKEEYAEYLNCVGLGHLPALTRVERGVIRRALGTPRLFSEKFLKQERDKVEQYRNSVRKHYTELHKGVSDGLPVDLAKPLSVGQRVITIHPKTRELHYGRVLTVDFSGYEVQFDCHELGVEFVKDIDCMPSNPSENMPAFPKRPSVALDKNFGNFNELKLNRSNEEDMTLLPDDLDNINGVPQLSSLAQPVDSLKKMKVASTNPDVRTMVGPGSYEQISYTQPKTLVQIHAKEADVNALTKLTLALNKKEAVVLELRHINDNVMENQKDSDSSLKDSEPFKERYAMVLAHLSEVNEEVSSAIFGLRQRNAYRGKRKVTFLTPVNLSNPWGMLNPSDLPAFQSSASVTEIIDSSRTRAQTIVDAAMQEISPLETTEETAEKIEDARIGSNNRLTPDSCMPLIPEGLITKCVAALLMIQNCTERRFPPSDIVQILDSAVTSLRPRSKHNLSVYTEIQRCMGIIRSQIMALVPT